MKIPFKERSISTLVVVPSAIIVAVLAVMQYHWSTGVSEATAVRLADSLQMSLVNWQIDFARYFYVLTLGMHMDDDDAAQVTADPQIFVRRLEAWRNIARYPDLVTSLSTEPADTREKTGQGWVFDAEAYELRRRLPSDASKDLVLRIDPKVVTRMFSDMSQTFFQGTNGLDYLVAVVSGNKTLYTSDTGFGVPFPADADGTLSIFARPQMQMANVPSPVKVFHAPSDDKGPSGGMRISWFAMPANAKEDWQVVVRHRRGGALGAFVAEMRRRDLAIGFGLVLVLVINMGMLILISHRAQRLAQLQMNFVTAVSHELRTPLTVIISGADNICNGVVENTPQLQQYGSLIGRQARQLFGLVERILLFAATRQGQQRYNLRPLQVPEVIEAALASAEGLLEAGDFHVKQDIAKDLPQVLGDSSALSQCLQNLITNGLKYGKEQRWLGIRAEVQDKEVQISVSDRGIGISPEDLAHIFEPFYRSPSVRAAQIHGTGLGLPLSQSIAEAMKGRLTVTSKLGEGSTFTLHLPVMQAVMQET